MQKLGIEEVQRRISQHSNTIVLSKEYVRNTHPLDCLCECGEHYKISYQNMTKHGHYKCNTCDHIKFVSWETIDRFIKDHSDSKLLIQDYQNEEQLLKIQCSCGNIFERKWCVLRQNIGFVCDRCSGITNWNIEMVKDWVEKNTTCQYLSDNYINANTKYKYLCECGNIYSCTWNKFYYGKQQKCQKCTSSRGENIIRRYLENNNYDYIYEKKFDNLKGVGGRKLSYDFDIGNSNYLIEYQGQYHDGTAKRQTKEAYTIQKQNDDIKRKYAINNNYQLIEIWYWDINNIEKILDYYIGSTRSSEDCSA